MRFLDGKSIGALGLTLTLGMATVGCGDDDSGPNDGGPDGGLDGSFAGNGGGGNGGNGSKDAGMDGSVTTGGTGGRTGGTGGGGALPVPMCNPDVPTTATCGGTECPAATSQFAAFTCSVPCCLPNDTCGMRRAVMDNETDCAGAGVEDPSCPEYMGMVPGGMMGATDAGTDAGADAGDAGGMRFVPCCAPSGHCGIISTIDMLCITSSQILTDLMPGPACGEGNDGGANDGGS